MRFFNCGDSCNFLICFGENNNSTYKPDEKIKELIPGVTDGASEKHIPVYKIGEDKIVVHVGEVEHPMLDEHYIEWILVETNQGFHLKQLKPADKTEAEFTLANGEQAICVYEYCNLHGLWKSDVK